MDAQMPHKSGLEALRELRDRNCDLPVVFVTGHTSPELRAELLAAGAQAVLPKPIDFDGLLRTLGSALNPGSESEAA